MPISPRPQSPLNTTSLVRTYLGRWSLRLDGPAIVGNIAVVQPVLTSSGGSAMLRLTPESDTFHDEVTALSLWDGDGAVRLYDHDAADRVVLLERLDSTRNLDSLPIDEAARVAGQLRARLSRRAPDGLITLESLAQRWAKELQQNRVLPKPIIDAAVAMCRELGPGANRYLVNEDQHYHNVLASNREPWLVIDPRVYAADREYGLATLLWGRLHESSTRRILNTLIDAEGLDAEKARAWTFVGAVTKWASSPRPQVARNCATIAHDLLPSSPILST
jgi:streptomycin 6-kinase